MGARSGQLVKILYYIYMSRLLFKWIVLLSCISRQSYVQGEVLIRVNAV